MPSNKIINATLKMLRKQSGLTQKQVADALGIDRSTYTYYETGTTSPSINGLIKLSKIFKVSIDYIITGEDRTDTHSGGVLNEPMFVFNADYAKESFNRFSDDEKQLLLMFRLLDEDKKKKILTDISKIAKEEQQQ